MGRVSIFTGDNWPYILQIFSKLWLCNVHNILNWSREELDAVTPQLKNLHTFFLESYRRPQLNIYTFQTLHYATDLICIRDNHIIIVIKQERCCL